MVKIALVDDDTNYREELLSYLRQYEQECGEKFHITTFTDGDEILDGYTASYDIILMDIAMRFVDGMETAERIRKMDSEVVIIFITNMPQYAMKGYTVDALDYVLKPLSYYAFSQRIDRALNRMRRRSKKYLTIGIKGGIKKLDVSQITYIEVQDHDLIYHTTTGALLSKGKLTEIEEQLDPKRFFRCGKSHLVNLEFVDGVQNNNVQVGDSVVQVSRARRKALLDALNDYINEVSK